MYRRRLRSFILAFMSQLGIWLHQCLLLRGSCIFILGSPEMFIPDCIIICVIKHANESPVVFSSWASSIILRICLHRQNGNLIIRAYKNWALFWIRSLLRTVGQILWWTIFASRQCRGEKAPILIVVARSSPCGIAWKNSLRSSKVGATKTSLKGLAKIWSIGT
jgi:hypothetical protein